MEKWRRENEPRPSIMDAIRGQGLDIDKLKEPRPSSFRDTIDKLKEPRPGIMDAIQGSGRTRKKKSILDIIEGKSDGLIPNFVGAAMIGGFIGNKLWGGKKNKTGKLAPKDYKKYLAEKYDKQIAEAYTGVDVKHGFDNVETLFVGGRNVDGLVRPNIIGGGHTITFDEDLKPEKLRETGRHEIGHIGQDVMAKEIEKNIAKFVKANPTEAKSAMHAFSKAPFLLGYGQQEGFLGSITNAISESATTGLNEGRLNKEGWREGMSHILQNPPGGAELVPGILAEQDLPDRLKGYTFGFGGDSLRIPSDPLSGTEPVQTNKNIIASGMSPPEQLLKLIGGGDVKKGKILIDYLREKQQQHKPQWTEPKSKGPGRTGITAGARAATKAGGFVPNFGPRTGGGVRSLAERRDQPTTDPGQVGMIFGQEQIYYEEWQHLISC